MSDQWIRKIGLYVQLSQEEFLDLSAFHIRFEVANADVESPNNASIRIYNLAKSTVKKLIEQGEFTQVTLNAGYINGNYGTIFQGNIKQFTFKCPQVLSSRYHHFSVDVCRGVVV